MNILLLQEADWFNKGPHQQHHLLERLSEKGHNIRVIDYPHPYKYTKNIFSKRKIFTDTSRFYSNAKIDVFRPSFVKLPILDYLTYYFTSKSEIKKSIKEFKPDIIIGYCSVLNNYIGSKYAKKHQIPYLYYWVDIIHELIPESIFRSLGQEIERRIITNSTKILVINSMLGKYIEHQFKIPKEKIIIIPGGVNIKDYQKTTDDKQVKELLKQYKINKTDTVIFFMGWLYHFSGLREFIEELSAHKKQRPGFKLLIVGKGDDFKNLQKLVKKEKLEKQVILTGYQPHKNIPDFLARADICILPAHYNEIMKDIVPIKMYEYMASSSPVIATKLPGILQEFGEENGVIYVNNPKDVFQKAADLYDTEKISVEGKKALKRVQENDWKSITNRFEQLLEELINT